MKNIFVAHNHVRNGTTNSLGEDLVLVEEPNVLPLVWPLRYIIATHPGKDGVVCLAKVKTVNGKYLAFVKLYKVPMKHLIYHSIPFHILNVVYLSFMRILRIFLFFCYHCMQNLRSGRPVLNI